jgi:hypothetical protein
VLLEAQNYRQPRRGSSWWWCDFSPVVVKLSMWHAIFPTLEVLLDQDSKKCDKGLIYHFLWPSVCKCEADEISSLMPNLPMSVFHR